MNNLTRSLAIIPIACAATTIWSQDRSALDNATASRVDKPIAAVVDSDDPAADAQIEAVARMLRGSHRARAEGNRPGLWLHVCPVAVTGVSDTLYFEIARDDGAHEPFQQGVMQLMRVQGGLRIRLHAFEGSVGGPLVGLWSEPAAMPSIESSALSIVADIPLSVDGDGFAGRTACAYPVARDGAVEATSAVRISTQRIIFEDEGFDASGQRVWGYTGDQAPVFVRRAEGDALPVRADRRESGLLVLTTKPSEPNAPVHAEGGELVVHYTGWLFDGRQFDSSRQTGREPFTIRLPGQVITGWNEGLRGLAKGERRRLIIPPELAYGVRGRPPVIPANSTLVFDVECLHVNNDPPAAGQPVPGAGGGGQTPPPRPNPTQNGS